jgi:serine/threonine-protein kinase RsbT
MRQVLEEVAVRNNTDIVTARNSVRTYAKQMGFGLVDQSRIATAVSELARNIVVYAKSGKVEIAKLNEGPKKGIEIVCEDNGPGIPDIEQAMSEGFTTGGSLGMGMPGTKKLVDAMDVWSEAGKGTRVTIRKFLK